MYDLEYSKEIENTQQALLDLKNYAQKGIKTLFVPNVRFGREIVELLQRTDIDGDTVTIDRNWDLNKWGFGDFYDLRGGVWDFELMYENLEQKLVSENHYDVMVIPGINGWKYFTARTKQAILARVKNGAGLILIQPFEGLEETETSILHELSPLLEQFNEGFTSLGYPGEGFPDIAFDTLKSEQWVSKEHYITRGIPFDVLPCSDLAFYPYKATGETILNSVSGSPIAAVKEVGKGRVVAFGYYPRAILPQHKLFTGKESTYDPIIDNWAGASSASGFHWLEYFYSMFYRSILWAGRRESETSLEAVTLEENILYFHCMNENKSDPPYFKVVVKNLYDEILVETVCMEEYYCLPPFVKFGGSYIVDVFVIQGNQLVDWGSTLVKIPKKIQISSIQLDQQNENMQVGEEVIAKISLNGSIDATLIFYIADDFGRHFHASSFEVSGAIVLEVLFKVPNADSQHLHLTAELHKDGILLQREIYTVIIAPKSRALTDFEVFMCPQNRGHGDFHQLIGKQYREVGVTGLFPGSPKTLAMSGVEGMGIYWYNRAAYVANKEAYLRTKDKQLLVRKPCLNDERFWQKLNDTITQEIKKFKKYGPIAYFANDEGSLTCYVDELELCLCENCMAKMRIWLRQKYGTIDTLNRTWGTKFEDFDIVVPYTTLEAKKAQEFASWGDHRTFMEMTFIDAYKRISEVIQTVDPEGKVRMSGCQSSTAYSGYDYYQLHKHVGYFDAYPSGSQYEFHRSFCQQDTVLGAWLGYGADGDFLFYNIWSGVLHNISVISLFWEYSCINPDFTLSKSANDIAKITKEIKEQGIGKLLLHGSKKDDCGIAIHYSMASVHGSNIIGCKDRFEDNRTGWLHLLEDIGFQYRFVASAQIEDGYLEREGFKLLILPYSIAISDCEAEKIWQFVNQGGVVIADFQTALMDENCMLFEVGKLDNLFGIERINSCTESFFGNDIFEKCKDLTYYSINADSNTDLVMIEPGIRATDGTPAFLDGFMKSVPAVIVNESEAGKTIYLNFALNNYPLHRKSDIYGGITRSILSEILAGSGIKTPVSLYDDKGCKIQKGYETFGYKNGEHIYTAVLKDLENEYKQGFDGLTIACGTEVDHSSDSVEIEFHREGHLYDIRAQKYIGYGKSAILEIKQGDCVIVSNLPEKVDGIRISAPRFIKAGEILEYSFMISGTEEKNPRTISINVFAPDGTRHWIYSKNLIIESNVGFDRLTLPCNEQYGLWKMNIKDVASGIQETVFIDVQ